MTIRGRTIGCWHVNGGLCVRTLERYDSSFRKTILVPFFYDNNIIMGAYLKFWYAYPEI